LCYSRKLNERVFQQPKIFPDKYSRNIGISISGIGSRNGFSVLMSNSITDLNLLEAGAQFFPLNFYEQQDSVDDNLLFNTKNDGGGLSSAINNSALIIFKEKYSGKDISFEDIFFYVYGILHSKEYRIRYANNLLKELPRIPLLKSYKNFRNFVIAGKKLGEMHMYFDKCDKYPITCKEFDLLSLSTKNPISFYRVERMKFAKKGQKSTVIYNKNITIQNIPLEAYDYVVNGRSALEWVMDRQCVKTDKSSGIINDANDYANETMNNPAYPLELFQRVITVSLETMKIVNSLPNLDID